MKRAFLSFSLSFFATLLMAQMKGNGSLSLPFQLYTLEEFLQFRDTVNNGFPQACADLHTDIDLSSICYGDEDSNTFVQWMPIGEGNYGTKYQGRFNGNGHIIKNLYVDSAVENFRGLFGATRKATILNVGIEDAYLHGGYYVGGLVGNGDSTTIVNCYVQGDIFGYFVSGIIGNARGCSLTNCYSFCDVQGNYKSGIIGYNEASSIHNCFYEPNKSSIGVGNRNGSATSATTEQFTDGTVCQKLNEYVHGIQGDSLVLWTQNAFPRLANPTNDCAPIQAQPKHTCFVQSHHIFIISSNDETINIYSSKGETTVRKIGHGTNDLGYFPSGIYIIKGKKVIVND